MNDAITMQIVGAALLLLGLVKMINPVKFNVRIYGDIPEAEVAKLASLRMVLGASVTGLALINLICSVMIDDAESSKALLMSTGIALLVFIGGMIGSKLRGFIDDIPLQPMVFFPMLSIICFVGAFV